ncbi:hypothetical protein HN031_12010 [Nocardioides sp. zg-1308]|uniref:hypothetical protein n=1 Tax=Nocardioides sp. zg-1308 TaxID=2736253 RepID=UPI001553483C|nr:hypothetical protein [Nocardioides sp. zg-1308]NPD05409.1 hypothetical protein [Nocardioides sp. zg-1308]
MTRRLHPRTGAVPALAWALAGALALSSCGDRSPDASASSGGSAADSSGQPARTEIPDDFPLASGMGGPGDRIATSRSGTGLRDLTLCHSTPLRGLGLRDRMVADNSGGESADTRELVLLGSADEAGRLATTISDLASACETPDRAGDTETLTEVRASPFGPAPASTLVQTWTIGGEPGDGATVVHVLPAGAALLVTSTYGQWTADELEEGVASTVAPLREATAALRMFDDDTTAQQPTQQPTEPTEPTQEPTQEPSAVPEDFPLDVGLPADGGDTTVSAPSPDGDGMGEVEMCGRVVWPQPATPGGVRRLVTGASGPEYFEGRELVVHEDAQLAVGAMDVLRAAASDCRTVRNQVWTVLDRDTGHDTVTVGLTYSDGLGSSVFQVTRVGSARVMVTTYGEGSLASLGSQADEVTETTGRIVPAMCVFTKTGC